jgi:hypothetical protein
MPKECTIMPCTLEDIKDCKFNAINGQHSALAVRHIIEDPWNNRKMKFAIKLLSLFNQQIPSI